jgi:hypothetical protein
MGAYIIILKIKLLLVFFVLVRIFAGLSCFNIIFAVFLLESFYSAGRIDKFLLARVERMAHRAYLSMDFIRRASRLESIAATATNNYLFIFWMYLLFHIFNAPKYLNQV